MSSRALRRLERSKDNAELLSQSPPSNTPSTLSTDSESERGEERGEEGLATFSVTPGKSSFALLALSSEPETESSEEGKETLLSREPSPPPISISRLTARRKKKTGGHASMTKSREELKKEPEEENVGGEEDEDEDEDIDKIMKELHLTPSPPGGNDVTATREELANSIFALNLDCLDPAAELKRKVGGIDREDDLSGSHFADAYGGGAAAARRLAALARRQQKRTRQHRYRGQLIVPRPLWPKVTAALVELRMRPIEHDLYGTQHVYQLSPRDSYQRQFEELRQLVELGDINLVHSFASRHPLHVDALIVMSDYLRMAGSAPEALELTERALYILEKCTLATDDPHLAPTTGLIDGHLRIPYDCPENRRLHLVLARYVQFLTRKGCYRTALEYGKICWSLDPLIDPLGMRLIVDFLALQAGQYDWFDSAFSQVDEEYPWMANWTFSSALMSFMRRGSSSSNTSSRSSSPSSSALASPAVANEKLQTAILTHPWMIPPLAKVCGLQLDESTWTNTFSIPLLSPHDYMGPLRDCLARIYAQRCGPLWRTPRVLAWLEAGLGMALSRANPKADSSATASTTIASPALNSIDYRPGMMEALPIFRHAFISDLPGVQVSLPVTISSGPVHPYDPLPPENVVDEEEAFSTGPSRCTLQ